MNLTHETVTVIGGKAHIAIEMCWPILRSMLQERERFGPDQSPQERRREAVGSRTEKKRPLKVPKCSPLPHPVGLMLINAELLADV